CTAICRASLVAHCRKSKDCKSGCLTTKKSKRGIGMRLSKLGISNFRSIANAEIDLSPFVCIVGHNNAGKSSMLVALSLFRSGSALKTSDFYDASKDIVIEVCIDGITDDALALIGVHADRIKEVLVDGRLDLVRRYNKEGKSK